MQNAERRAAPGTRPRSGLEVAGNLVLLAAALVGAVVVLIGVLNLFGVQQVSIQSRSVSSPNWTDTGLRTVLAGAGVTLFIAVHGWALRAWGRRRAARASGVPGRPLSVGAFVALVVGGAVAVLAYLVIVAVAASWLLAKPASAGPCAVTPGRACGSQA